MSLAIQCVSPNPSNRNFTVIESGTASSAPETPSNQLQTTSDSTTTAGERSSDSPTNRGLMMLSTAKLMIHK